MKKSSIFYILACMTSLFIFSSCEENVDQVVKTQPDATQEITNRSIEDCGDCPLDYCCAAIELLQAGNPTIQFCGVYTAMSGTPCGPFSPGSPCGTISGSTSSIPLSGLGDRGLFCIPNGGSFRIVQSSGATISIRITIEYDEINPTWEYIELENGIPQYFDTGENCGDLNEC